jgi:hypothetical protein
MIWWKRVRFEIVVTSSPHAQRGLELFHADESEHADFCGKTCFFTKKYLGLVMLFFAAHVSSSSIAEFFAIAMAFIMMSVAVLAYEPISHECLDG